MDDRNARMTENRNEERGREARPLRRNPESFGSAVLGIRIGDFVPSRMEARAKARRSEVRGQKTTDDGRPPSKGG
jgi:hypothetical protein